MNWFGVSFALVLTLQSWVSYSSWKIELMWSKGGGGRQNGKLNSLQNLNYSCGVSCRKNFRFGRYSNEGLCMGQDGVHYVKTMRKVLVICLWISLSFIMYGFYVASCCVTPFLGQGWMLRLSRSLIKTTPRVTILDPFHLLFAGGSGWPEIERYIWTRPWFIYILMMRC